MTRGRRWGALLAAAVLVPGLLTACSGADDVIAPAAAEAAATTAPSPGGPATPQVVLGPLRRPHTPREAARIITAAEAVIADPRSGARRLAQAGELAQLAYRELGVHPRWDDRVDALLSPRLRVVTRHDVASRREFRSMHYSLSDTLPAWRIIAPAPAKDLRRFYLEAQRRFGVDWEYLAAINLVETGMGRIRGYSVAGARGPMQFIPSTWDAYGRGDIDDPHDAIQAAGRYLEDRGFTAPGGIAGALYSYNNHPAYVRGVTHLAKVMKRDPRAFLGYYHWQVYYLTTRGDVRLPVGYRSKHEIPVDRYMRDHPQPQ